MVKRKYSKQATQVIAGEMHKWGKGALHSGSKTGPVVKSQKQAIAIAISSARRKGYKVPGGKRRKKKRKRSRK